MKVYESRFPNLIMSRKRRAAQRAKEHHREYMRDYMRKRRAEIARLAPDDPDRVSIARANVAIDRDLHAALKAYAIRTNQSLRSIIERLILEQLGAEIFSDPQSE